MRAAAKPSENRLPPDVNRHFPDRDRGASQSHQGAWPGTTDLSVSDLLGRLIRRWSAWETHETQYLTQLAPQIVRDEAKLDDVERELVLSLRARMTDAEWQGLPSAIARRRAELVVEDETAQRQRIAEREARDKAEADRARERAEAHRRRRETEAANAREQAAAERKRRETERGRQLAEETARKRQLEREAAQRERRAGLMVRLRTAMDTDFLSIDSVLANDPDAGLLDPGGLDDAKARYVQEWASRELGETLDREQATAVAATGGDVLVTARAGSGKTRTLVSRALFLARHCGVPPRDLLLLAFNKDAADVMRARVAKVLKDEMPHVMTFHALAHALVHPEEDLIYDDASADQLVASRELQEIIDALIRFTASGPRIRDLMLANFRDDWERIETGGFHLEIDEFLKHRRSLPRQTLNGDYVKSYGEKLIANALFEQAVSYRYERNFHWDGINYRPDFTIETGRNTGIVIEYFGLAGDADYDASSAAKREFWAKNERWTFLELTPTDLLSRGVAGFVAHLLSQVTLAGAECRRRSEEEIWELVRHRALDGFTAAMKTFVGRCRVRGLDGSGLDRLIGAHRAISHAETLFLSVAQDVYAEYLDLLQKEGKEDFSGLLWRAVALVDQGSTRFIRDRGREQGDVAAIRHVLVDEFQDFSGMFAALIEAVRKVSPTPRLYCVGDDWQAINGFAGSELRFFRDFATLFPQSRRYELRTNYRSPRHVVELGNAVMAGRGASGLPGRADTGEVLVCRMDEFVPSAAEAERHGGDDITPAVLRLVKKHLDSGHRITILARMHHVPWYVAASEHIAETWRLAGFLSHLRSHLDEEDRPRLTISTAHRYKGREQDAVIVVDAVRRAYPLLHPNWVFQRVFGDTIPDLEEAERRLFYVAVTRASKSLSLITEKQNETPFIRDARDHGSIASVKWQHLEPMPSRNAARVEVRVSGVTFGVKDQLKNLGYHWRAQGSYWCRLFSREGFHLEPLTRQAWCKPGIVVRVYSEAAELLDQYLPGASVRR